MPIDLTSATNQNSLPRRSDVPSPPSFPKWGWMVIGIIIVLGGVLGSLGLGYSTNNIAASFPLMVPLAFAGALIFGYGLYKAKTCPKREANLRTRILNTPIHESTVLATTQSLYTPVHQICDHLYLGNYRAFLSVDPKFLGKYDTVESLEELRENGLQITEGKYEELRLGCSKLDIKLIISVTQFQPSPSVPADDWSRFTPNLEHVTRIQIPAHDDEEAWGIIESKLEDIFVQIDQARTHHQNVLIHCVEGSSRSAAVMYAYLMSRFGITLDQAFNYVRSIRPHVQIKPTMEVGLKAYYQKLHPLPDRLLFKTSRGQIIWLQRADFRTFEELKVALYKKIDSSSQPPNVITLSGIKIEAEDTERLDNILMRYGCDADSQFHIVS